LAFQQLAEQIDYLLAMQGIIAIAQATHKIFARSEGISQGKAATSCTQEILKNLGK
jgi:hypothetical protein